MVSDDYDMRHIPSSLDIFVECDYRSTPMERFNSFTVGRSSFHSDTFDFVLNNDNQIVSDMEKTFLLCCKALDVLSTRTFVEITGRIYVGYAKPKVERNDDDFPRSRPIWVLLRVHI